MEILHANTIFDILDFLLCKYLIFIDSWSLCWISQSVVMKERTEKSPDNLG